MPNLPGMVALIKEFSISYFLYLYYDIPATVNNMGQSMFIKVNQP